MQLQHQTQTNAQNRMTGQSFRGQLIQFAFYLKKQGKEQTTIKTQCGSLRNLYNLGANLYDPESVKEIVVNPDCSTRTPGLFACGDVTNTLDKRIIIASGEGAKAALAARRYLLKSSPPTL